MIHLNQQSTDINKIIEERDSQKKQVDISEYTIYFELYNQNK